MNRILPGVFVTKKQPLAAPRLTLLGGHRNFGYIRRVDDQATVPPTAEHELVARCRRGDREAQRALYEQTSQRVFRLLARMTRSREVAEELAQETYLKAFSAFASFGERSSVHTWLHRIAVNEALQWLRRSRPMTANPKAVDEMSNPASDGQTTAMRIDIETAMAELDPVDRAMLLLRYQEGLDYRAIAEISDVAMGTVASRLNRARERLRGLLRDFAPEREEGQSTKHRINRGREGAARISRPVEESAS
ncbi:MAG: sigma-70 family RNA polymerase sigma factor [Phycisphaerae bacterium]|nr:sigma-70 family RNA polymerase sigma factor [Phycisphaerae bacterium]